MKQFVAISQAIVCLYIFNLVDINTNGIANAIIDFYKNNKEHEFSQNTKEEKKRFHWSSFVDGLMKLVSSL